MFDNNDNLSNDTHSNNWLYPSLIKMGLITFAKLRRLCFHLGLFGWLFLAKMRWCGVFQFAALFVYLDGRSRMIQHVHLSLVQIFIWFQGWRSRSRGHKINRNRKCLTLLLSYIKTCSPTYCKTCVHDIINLRYYFEFAHLHILHDSSKNDCDMIIKPFYTTMLVDNGVNDIIDILLKNR